jgi:hypothetical protein
MRIELMTVIFYRAAKLSSNCNRNISGYFFIILLKNGSGVHPSSYTMGKRRCFPGGKAVEA